MILVSGEIFNALPVLSDNTKAQRYPTDVEIKKVMPQFHRRVQGWEKSPSRIQRTQAEINDLDSFAKAWLQKNPKALPFLGSWHTWEDFITIYPSTSKDDVCIFYSGSGVSGNGMSGSTYVSLGMGKVINSQVHTSNFAIIFRQGNYLGAVFVDSKENIRENAYLSPIRPPKFPEIPLMQDQSKLSQKKLFREFTQAGCRDSIP
jgi:hypothetical protein